MFLGLRDIAFAKGRFALIAAVVGLLTLLLVMLTGLTGGLGEQNTAGLESLGADRIVFGSAGTEAPELSYTSSKVTAQDQKVWEEEAGVETATPVGISQTVGETETGSVSLAVFAFPAGSPLLGQSAGAAVAGSLEITDQGVVIGQKIAQENKLTVGDRLTLSGQPFEVEGIAQDTYYSHTPVVWTTTAGWQRISHLTPAAGESETVGTVLALSAPSLTEDQITVIADQTHTLALTTRESFAGLAAYQSERGSLQAMQGFLYAISALVTLSFLTVWTIQRTRDLAVLRALGGASSYLVKDALTQSALILLIGAVSGMTVGWLLGALAQNILPFQLDALTVAGPAVGIWLIGVLGSLIATSRITKIDPMIALGGN